MVKRIFWVIASLFGIGPRWVCCCGWRGSTCMTVPDINHERLVKICPSCFSRLP